MIVKFFNTFKIYWHKTILAAFLMGLASGMPFVLLGSTMSAWLNDYGISKKAIGLFAVVGMPFSLKFLWAPFVDGLRIPILTKLFGQRRAWLITSQLLLAASFVIMGHIQPDCNIQTVAICALITAFMAATQDIVVDAYRIELLRPQQQAAGLASEVFGYRVGMMIAGSLALIIADFFKKRSASNDWGETYTLMGLALAFIAVLVMFITNTADITTNNEPNQPLPDFKTRIKDSIIKPFLYLTHHKYWLLILILLTSFKASDAFATSLLTPFLRDIGFTLTQIGIAVKLFGFIASSTGGFLGGVLAAQKGSLLGSLLFCGILQATTNAIYILQHHIGNNIYALYATISIENIVGGVSTTVFIAYVIQLCNNKQYTATQYAALSSAWSLGRVAVSMPSGFVVNSMGWDAFFIVSMLLAVPSLLIIIFLRNAHKKQLDNITAQPAEQPS